MMEVGGREKSERGGSEGGKGLGAARGVVGPEAPARRAIHAGLAALLGRSTTLHRQPQRCAINARHVTSPASP